MDRCHGKGNGQASAIWLPRPSLATWLGDLISSGAKEGWTQPVFLLGHPGCPGTQPIAMLPASHPRDLWHLQPHLRQTAPETAFHLTSRPELATSSGARWPGPAPPLRLCPFRPSATLWEPSQEGGQQLTKLVPLPTGPEAPTGPWCQVRPRPLLCTPSCAKLGSAGTQIHMTSGWTGAGAGDAREPLGPRGKPPSPPTLTLRCCG